MNAKFAEAVLEEIEGSPAIVLVQDYHFALLPRILKTRRPDAIVSHFWHIPWPHREAFRICPWQTEILDGLLGSDLLGFHVQLHCNNFLETVDRLIESRVDYERFSVTRAAHETKVRPFPISIDMEGISHERAYAKRCAGLQKEALVCAMNGQSRSAWIAWTIPRAYRNGCGRSTDSSIATRSGTTGSSSCSWEHPAGPKFASIAT